MRAQVDTAARCTNLVVNLDLGDILAIVGKCRNSLRDVKCPTGVRGELACSGGGTQVVRTLSDLLVVEFDVLGDSSLVHQNVRMRERKGVVPKECWQELAKNTHGLAGSGLPR